MPNDTSVTLAPDTVQIAAELLAKLTGRPDGTEFRKGGNEIYS